MTAFGAHCSRGQTQPYIVSVERQALAAVESAAYCDSVRIAQDSVIAAQRNELHATDSIRVNAEARAQTAQNEGNALKYASDKDRQILREKEGENRRLRLGNLLLKIAMPVVVVATAVVTIVVKDKMEDR